MQTTMTSKGQVTLPKSIREALGLEAGSKLDIEVRDGVIVARPVSLTALDIFGAFRQPGRRPVSVDEMDEAIAEQASARFMRASGGDEAGDRE